MQSAASMLQSLRWVAIRFFGGSISVDGCTYDSPCLFFLGVLPGRRVGVGGGNTMIRMVDGSDADRLSIKNKGARRKTIIPWYTVGYMYVLNNNRMGVVVNVIIIYVVSSTCIGGRDLFYTTYPTTTTFRIP